MHRNRLSGFRNLARFSALAVLTAMLTAPAALAGWREAVTLVPSDTFQLDNFGCSVAMSGNKVLAGAKYDDDMGPSSGSGVIFRQGLLAHFGPAGGH